MILDSAVGRARVGCGRHVWVGATPQQATACKKEQHPQARCQRLNRVRSAITQKARLINAKNLNGHWDLLKEMSGQLRHLG